MARKNDKPEKPPVVPATNKQKAIELAVSSIEKQFGKGSILTMDGESTDYTIGVFSSGSPSIDRISATHPSRISPKLP